MNPRVTLGLLAVLLTLGGYVYFAGPTGGQADQATAKDKIGEQQFDVLRFDDRDIQRIVADVGGQQTVAEKDAEGLWKLQPGGESADRLRIVGLVSRLSSLRATRRLSEPGSLADYGLLTPNQTVALRQSDGREHTVLFGAKAPAEAGTYAKVGDDAAVYVVANAVAQDAERLVTEPPRESPSPSPLPTSAP